MSTQQARGILVLFVLSVMCWVPPVEAQVTTATILGTAKDQTGAILPGVTVTAKNEGTGSVRVAVTDSSGRYRLANLPIGSYEVRGELVGFSTEVRRGLVLTIGQELVFDVSLAVGEVSEQVVVTGETGLVQTTSSSVSGVVEQTRIANLPLNGRDFTKLALVQAGVFQTRKADVRGTKGFGTRISMAGSRVDQTAWLLDGTNIRGAQIFGVPGSSSGLVLGVEAVAEFQVLTSNFSAEVGGTSGGIVNMVSKSGTNAFHGSAYAFHRNDGMDAKNFFDVEKPDFVRNQFGASIGGPIKRDRLLFFANYEGLKQDLGQTLIAIVPDENAHRGLIPAARGGLEQVPIAASTRPFLDLYPMPNGPAVGTNSGLAQLISPATEDTDQHYFTGRMDYRVNDSTNVFGRFTFDQGDQVKPAEVPISGEGIYTRTRYTTLQYQKVVTSRLLATSRFAYNRSRVATSELLNIDFPASTRVFNPNLPAEVSFTGASTIGTVDSPIDNTHDLFQVTQAMDYTRGAHSMKFGADFQFIKMYYDGGGRDHGILEWGSLRDFLVDARFESFAAAAPGSDARRWLRQQYYGVYFQDDWAAGPGLTLNLGIRYDPFTVPVERDGRLATIRDWRTATQYETDTPFFRNPSKKNISPRVGFAWDPWQDGKTALRGGVGLFFVPIVGPQYRTQTFRNPPFFGQVQQPLGNLASALDDVNRVGPSLLTPVLTSRTFVQLPNWDVEPSYEAKYNLSLQREFPGALSVMLGYLGGRGKNLWRLASCNAAPSVMIGDREFVAAGTPRPNRNMGSCAMNFTDAESFYNGLLLEVKKRFSQAFQFQTSYTWSKAIDDSTTGVVSTDYLEGDSSRPYNRKADRGLAAFHVAHNLVINGLLALPSPQGTGPANQILGGWNLSGILSIASGNPFSPGMSGRNAPDLSRSAGRQRPDVLPGSSYSAIIDPRNPIRYFDPSIFVMPEPGFYGNAGRNVLIGPGLLNFDLGLRKNVSLGGQRQMEIRADLFNVFNRANFATPNANVLNAATRRPIASAGLIRSTTTTARQMQLGLRFVF